MESAINSLEMTQGQDTAPVLDLGFLLPLLTAGLVVTAIVTALFILSTF